MGFTTGQEVDWLPRATSSVCATNWPISRSGFRATIRRRSPTSSQRGKLDVAFLRAEQTPDIEFKVVAQGAAGRVLPSDHRLAARKTSTRSDLAGETYIGISKVPRVLRALIADYFERCGIEIIPAFEIDNYAMAISLVASTRGFALLPASAENFLPWSVVSATDCRRGTDDRRCRRPSQGEYLGAVEAVSGTGRRPRRACAAHRALVHRCLIRMPASGPPHVVSDGQMPR